MGTITERQTKDGRTRYRAAIRINKDGTKYSESRTFSKRNLAEAWLKKREAEIEINPESLHTTPTDDMRFADVAELYLEQIGSNFGRSHRLSILFVSKQPLGAKYLGKLKKIDFANYAEDRLKSVKPQTLAGDMVSIRAVLRYAKMVRGMDVNLEAFEEAVLGLRYARKIKGSDKRNRLPTSDELQALTNIFYSTYQRQANIYPMHLIMWFAIYTARRESEIVRLSMSDFRTTENGNWWLVRDMKNPLGSQGNHKNIKVPDIVLPIIEELRDGRVQNRMKVSKYYRDNHLIPLDAKNISRLFTEACRMLGIQDLHFHDLRHEAATRLAEQGLSIPQMQQVTGHDSWSSLQRYTNLKERPAVLEFDAAMKQAIKNHEMTRGI